MRSSFWQALVLRWRRAWRQVLGRSTRKERPADSGNVKRARFWAEFREGEREAEARAGRRP
jgi:hypothetical protein